MFIALFIDVDEGMAISLRRQSSLISMLSSSARRDWWQDLVCREARL